MATLTTAMGDVEVHQWGQGPRTIVALHAAASGPRALARLAEGMAARGWRVLAPALAGYGATRVESRGRPIAVNVAIAQACLAHAGASGGVLFGHSFGGLVALRAGLTMAADCPVVVYEPVAFGVLDRRMPEDCAALSWDRAIAAALAAQVAAGDREGGVKTFIEAWNETDWEQLPRGSRASLVAAADNLLAEVGAVARDDRTASDYALLGARLTLLRGDRSPRAARLIANRLREAVPGSRLWELAGAGHMAPALLPEAMAGMLAKALDGER